MQFRALSLFFLIISAICCTGCFSVNVSKSYPGPTERPQEMLDYYSVGASFTDIQSETITSNEYFTLRRITINSAAGETKIDLYRKPGPADDKLILVFPLLGGSNKIADYFAEYYVQQGFDTAIVSRSEDFKNPEGFFNLEQIFRGNVIRDRIALDYFEKVEGKHDFGSFGISRGAINVAITAGVDSRLKHNVMALGATDLVRIIKGSNEKRIVKYKNSVMERFNLTEKEFFTYLTENLRTDPKKLAQYIDARHTLLFLALLDKTVPIQYGIKLRQAIGGPKTVYLLADHYLSIGFTGIAKVAAPQVETIGFPFDYIEQEALDFYKKSFATEDHDTPTKLIPFHVAQAPLNLLAEMVDAVF